MTIISITRSSERTRILTFDDNISVFVVLGPIHTFICDTHLGPVSMKEVQDYIMTLPEKRTLVIFNSHSDWDHIWGNCSFPDSIIVGHTLCRKRIEERGLYDLSRLSSSTRGQVILKPPNLTFQTELCFEDDDVKFIHAPGHTIDSSLCYDRKENILYIGDLVEEPIPYLDYDQLDKYIETLDFLLTFSANIIVSAHSGIVTPDLIRKNKEYVQSVMEGKKIDTTLFGSYTKVHQANLNTLQMFGYEKQARMILKEQYDFSSFWSLIPDLEETEPDKLHQIMREYHSKIIKTPI